ncbi:TetR/AcrR family transcriptional regulator [Gottfriedia sp. NPDC056225]|uniref:TetR/AcrR family transcriptional regulator n=1 Tax=Gottfriedia sp. NPDC056225 TaxID=3345751 RepID=UPI0035D984D9
MSQEKEIKLPQGVAISWGVASKPQRGPKRELSIEQIVGAAIEIADRDGIEAVSMNRVATSLGYTTMSLYRYIPSKDDLLLLMQEAASKDANFTSNSDMDWRSKMREYFRTNMEVFQKHHWFADIPISGVPITPNQLKFVDYALYTMRDLPLNDYEKMSFVLLLSGYSRWCGTIVSDMLKSIKSGKSENAFNGVEFGDALKKLVTPEQFPDLYPVIMSNVYIEDHPENNPIGNDFEFGLERILDGIEHYIKLKEQVN